LDDLFDHVFVRYNISVASDLYILVELMILEDGSQLPQQTAPTRRLDDSISLSSQIGTIVENFMNAVHSSPEVEPDPLKPDI
jgi:hypothetical protein